MGKKRVESISRTIKTQGSRLKGFYQDQVKANVHKGQITSHQIKSTGLMRRLPTFPSRFMIMRPGTRRRRSIEPLFLPSPSVLLIATIGDGLTGTYSNPAAFFVESREALGMVSHCVENQVYQRLGLITCQKQKTRYKTSNKNYGEEQL